LKQSFSVYFFIKLWRTNSISYTWYSMRILHNSVLGQYQWNPFFNFFDRELQHTHRFEEIVSSLLSSELISIERAFNAVDYSRFYFWINNASFDLPSRRDRVLHESGGKLWTCIIETSGAKGRCCVIIRVRGRDSRAYRIVPLRINDAFRGRSIEGLDNTQWNDIAVIIREVSPSGRSHSAATESKHLAHTLRFINTHSVGFLFFPIRSIVAFKLFIFCPSK